MKFILFIRQPLGRDSKLNRKKSIKIRLGALRPAISYSALHHSETFIISAIVTVLSVRLLLQVTGYPQVGAGQLHVAHVLWGGLLMLVAVSLQINLLGDRPRALAALFGGVGFGLFIDELGKFLTKNNDYFFKPTAVLLYGLFLSLWFLARLIDKRRSHSRSSAAANVMELLQEGLLYGFNSYERSQLSHYLSRLDADDQLSLPLKNLAQTISQCAQVDELSLYLKFRQSAHRYYLRLAKWRYFGLLIVLIFGLQLILSFVGLADFIKDMVSNTQSIDINKTLTISELGQLIGTVFYGGLVAFGLGKLRDSRLEAFQIFKTALLVNILITQCFAFYRLKFWAMFGLLVNIAVLSAVNYIIQLEHRSSPS